MSQFVNRPRDVIKTSEGQDGLLRSMIEEIAKKSAFTESGRKEIWHKGMWLSTPTSHD